MERKIDLYDLHRDVRRLLERIQHRPSQYDASLDARYGAPYPVIPVATPLGTFELRLLGRDAAEVAGEATIYGVGYRLFVHIERVDGEWRRYQGVTGLERLDGNYGRSISPARARFEKVALPAIAAALATDDVALLREGAQALRLISLIEGYDRNAREIEGLMTTLRAASDAETRSSAAAYCDLAGIHGLLSAACAPVAEAA